MHQYFIIYKPFRVLSQFSASEGKETLKDYFKVPPDVYPVGRLDYDSEGLLILTNDKKLNFKLLSPSHQHEREYWVQVEGSVENSQLKNLSKGVQITVDGKKYTTAPCMATLFATDPIVPVRLPPIRFRKNIPTSWIRISLKEGKNRQVRKMTAAVGLPTLRLIRFRIGALTIDGLQPGEMHELSGDAIHQLLFQ